MPRRSARLAGTSSASVGSPAYLNPTATVGNHDDSEGSDEELVRPKKRQKQPKANTGSHPSFQFKKVRGCRGALKDIVEMPLDILQEIFMYLVPVEVLALSRMCKAVRRILMTKSAECVWRQARLNLGNFPDCPDDLNEAQFANLVFDAFCDYCDKAKGRYFIWSTRRRCCRACIENKNGLVGFYSLAFTREDQSDWWPILPSINLRSKTEIVPDWPTYNLFCEASAIRLLEEFKEYQKSYACQAQKAWARDKLDEKKHRIAHGRLCEKWLRERDKNRAAQLDDIRQHRFKAIKQRLTDIGYEKELKTISGMDKWSTVKQPKILTDRIWKNIKDDIIAKLEEHRAYRLKQDYLAAECDRKRQLKQCLYNLEQKNLGKVICPDSFILESTQQISALIKAPAEEVIEFPEPVMLELVQNWRQSTDTDIREMIIAGSTPTDKPNAIDPLLLATTFFRCWRGCHSLQYPEILNHKCATYNDYAYGRCLWNADGQRVFFSDKAYSLAKIMLEASGLDPLTTTREDVQWPKFYIECCDCPTIRLTGGDRLLMAWPKALGHAVDHDRRDEHPRMARADLSDHELSRVQELVLEDLRWSRGEFLCVRCEEPCAAGNWDWLKSHISEKHNDQKPREPVYITDYVMKMDTYGFRPQPPRHFFLRSNDGTNVAIAS